MTETCGLPLPKTLDFMSDLCGSYFKSLISATSTLPLVDSVI
jgi:hypothetical protein